MKTHFNLLILFIAFSLAGNAQSLLLEYQQQPLNNQSVIVRSGTPDTLDMTTWLKITNISSDTVMVMAKKELLVRIPEASGSICWAGYCYQSEINQSLYPLKMSPGESATGCFAHFSQQGKVGLSKIRWTYFLENNPDDSVCVTINYQIWNAGVEDNVKNDASFSLPFPNPATDVISFRREDSTDGDYTVSIYGLTGKMILKDHFIPGTSVLSLSAEDLPAGIYYYTIDSANRAITRGKFILRP